MVACNTKGFLFSEEILRKRRKLLLVCIYPDKAVYCGTGAVVRGKPAEAALPATQQAGRTLLTQLDIKVGHFSPS